MVVVGVAFWGVHMGMSQGLLASMVADVRQPICAARPLVFFNLACGVAMLLASVCAGALWDGVGPAATFYAGAGFAALTGVMLWRTAKN